MIINLSLAIGILIFLLGLGADIFLEWTSIGYIVSRVGMAVFAIGMLAYMIRAFRPKERENKIFKP